MFLRLLGLRYVVFEAIEEEPARCMLDWDDGRLVRRKPDRVDDSHVDGQGIHPLAVWVHEHRHELTFLAQRLRRETNIGDPA